MADRMTTVVFTASVALLVYISVDEAKQANTRIAEREVAAELAAESVGFGALVPIAAPLEIPPDVPNEEQDGPLDGPTAGKPVAETVTAKKPTARLLVPGFHCAGCERWKNRADSLPVKLKIVETDPPPLVKGRQEWPTLHFEVDGKWFYWNTACGRPPDGAWETQEESIDAFTRYYENATKITQGLRTRSELDAWVRANYSRDWVQSNGWNFSRFEPIDGTYSEVEPPGHVWAHLQDENHGFSAEQVQGLEFWVAWCLHDAAHRGTIGPEK